MKRKIFAAAAFALGALFMLCGCSSGNASLTQDLPERKDAVVSSEAYRIFEEARESGYTGSYLQFLDEYDLPEKESADPVQTALRSVVLISASFNERDRWQTNTVRYSGAGVVWAVSEGGDMLVITNYHVVYDANSVGSETVRHVSDGIVLYLYGSSDAIKATFAGGSMDYDVALLRIDGEERAEGSERTNAEIISQNAVEEAAYADSRNLVAGERVYAIGNPNGEGIAATEGIVSVEAENITMSRLDGTGEVSMLEIRTDAAVNHGNSGGGLFDETGALVGLVNARSEESGVESFGYAIPSAIVEAVVNNVIDNGGTVSRATLGITVGTASSRNVLEGNAVRIAETVQVRSVESGAALGKLQTGDNILSLSYGGKTFSVTRQYHITIALLGVREGDTVTVAVERGGKTAEEEITFTAGNFTQVK